MSGHSKWSTIKRQKGAADAKRGQLFTKISNAITIAVRESGGSTDPENNFKLRLAIDKARAANMPKENIDRAITRAVGKQGLSLETSIYEGFAPGKVAVIVQTVSDNKQRTVSEIKNVFEKGGGILATPGSVSYLFSIKGELSVQKKEKNFDEIFTLALDCGVEDIEEEDDRVVMYCENTALSFVKKSLEEKGLSVETAEIIYKPNSLITISNKDMQNKIIQFLEKVEDLDDVQKVYTNADFIIENVS